MIFSKTRFIFAAALMAASFAASAGVILSNTGLTEYDRTENFDTGTSTSNISGDFGTSGLHLSTLGGGGLSLIANNSTSCNFTSRGMNGNFLGMGLRSPCVIDATVNNYASMQFGGDVSELSWFGFSFANGRNGDGIAVEAYRKGLAVDDMQILFNQNNRFNGLYVTFSGAVFDELRFSETDAARGYIGIDEMAWKFVAVDTATEQVPEPGSILLMGVGVLGLASRVHKHKAK